MAQVTLEGVKKIYDNKVVAVHDFNLNIKDKEFVVRNEDQYSKCGWTPYEGETLKGWIETVLVNGNIVLKDGQLI